MFLINQDYRIINSDTPVLTRQENGQFEFQDCYFLEITIKPDDKTTKKIEILGKPFDYITAIQLVISKYNFSNNQERLFMLVGPDTIKNNFQCQDDFLALALCTDERENTTIQYFEVNYKFRHSYEPNQKYKRVGTSAVSALQKFYQSRELCGRSALDALEFWFKNGFTRLDEREQYLHWRQK